MKIKPLPGIVQLKIDEVHAGVLDTSSRESAVEYAEVLAVGNMDNAPTLDSVPKVGDHVFVKSWAIDIITHQDKRYYFCNIETGGILAVVK
jgi:co-chaperonin GroES (HSP10)